ncbi:DNA polymerase III subunit delta [Calditerrivibrio nitroreducens]|uniref:DNA-directed DNA polymerase n=1 Tax=Calditerrivibrio nitroreducens (strain DSM 19672 / NBRC 101217 / Yu37-1) TaxID=768670 RepID=E4TEX8_CALNY|nr:DNA polymerase III subunit delta [Calditerrivibrio nitroreducens]ADR18384.1 DNA polymerase III delta [Calditerrivibrio nitroreducens DSM 19672]
MTSKKIKNRILVAGSQSFIEDKLRDLVKDVDQDSVRYFYGDELDIEGFFEYTSSIPLFYEQNIAVLKHAEDLKEKLKNEILEGLSKIEANFVILTFLDEKPVEENYKKFKESFNIIIEPKRSFNAQMIQQYFKDEGLIVGVDTAKYIFEMCNKDPMILKNELEKIKIFYNYEKPRSDEEIISLVSFSRSESIYQFIKNFFSKDLNKTLAIFKVIVDDGESVERIFYELSRHIVSLSFYIISPSLVTEYTYTIHNYKDYINRWSKNEVAELVELIAEIDLFLKTGRETYLSGLYRIIYTLLKKD